MRRPAAQACLILTADAGTGRRIASILGHCRWRTTLVHSDLQAYDSLKHGHYDFVIADIDSADVNGQAVLAYCHRRFPEIATYAIVRPDDVLGKALAREAGGCRGYYHLYEEASRD